MPVNPIGKGLFSSGEFNSTTVNMDINATFAAPAAAQKVIAYAPVDGTIIGWIILGSASGSAVIDVWRTSVAGAVLPAIPTVANTIAGTYLPTLVTASAAFGGSTPGYVPNASSMLQLGWGGGAKASILVQAGDFFIFNINSYTAGGSLFVALIMETGS